VDDCADCAAHSAGICFSHKMKHWRETGHGGVNIPAHFKAAVTQREIMRDMDDAAKATGRGIQKAR